jgi:transposase
MIYLTILTKRNSNSIEAYTVFDELIYKTHFVVERTNAWLDAFKAVLVCFETNNLHWKSLLLLAFAVILLRKL